MSNIDKFMEYVANSSLEELATVISAIADKSYEYRLSHGGMVPREVFEALMGPDTVSVQLVHQVYGAKPNAMIGFALRFRTPNEAGYGGLFHSTCCSMRWSDDIETALARDDSDAFAGKHNSQIEFLGITKHHESPRRNMDMTFMHRRIISMSDIEGMNGEWKFFSNEEILSHDERIVPSNWYQLEWVMNENRPWFGSLIKTYPPQLK